MASSSRSKEVRPVARYYLVGLALFMIGVVIAGFWPSYFGPGLRGNVPEDVSNAASFPWLVHLHATVFLGWMGMLLAQTSLVARGKTHAHMSVGRYGIGLGTVVLLVGLVLTFLTYQTIVSQGNTWVGAVTVAWQPLVDMIEFGVLLTIGYLYRTRPEVHKRMMLFATVALLHAATGRRMNYLLGPWSLEIMFTIEVGLIYGYDLVERGRIHPASLVGTLIVLPDVIFHYLPFLAR